MSTAQQRRRVEIYDTTLRDGTQGAGVSFTLADKLKITRHLDALGIDYIEGGYPLSNPKDAAYFEEVRRLKLRHAKVAAFGMTRRKGIAAAQDTGMQALVEAQAPVVTIVGKSWDLHVEKVLGVTRAENLDMIRDSVDFCRRKLEARGGHAGGSSGGHSGGVFYDAEHFFDGFAANRDYALATLQAALEGGAVRLILCDTNGGSLPARISQTVREVLAFIKTLPMAQRPREARGDGAGEFRGLGIHVHNDGGLAVANSLAAVEAGCGQVQGTINGIGERCGNVDLTTVIANLHLKMGLDCLQASPDGIPGVARLTETSRFVYEVANLNLVPSQPYVGTAAFAHKGGMHVHAVQKVAASYEHVPPEKVGNTRRVLISELSGVSNVAATLGTKFPVANDKAFQRKLVQKVAELENQGYQFEAAGASFELLLHDLLGDRPRYWDLDHYRCTILKRNGDGPTTEATVKMLVDGQMRHEVAEGDGPVNALDGALRKCLLPAYPQIGRIHLRDYKVRVVNATAESAAKVRVVVDFSVLDGTAAMPKEQAPAAHFTTVGVSENIVDASWQALMDAFVYHLIECQVKPAQ